MKTHNKRPQVSADIKSKIALLLRRRIGSQREDKDFDLILRKKALHIFVFSMAGLVCMMLTAVATWFISAGTIQNCELTSETELTTDLKNLILPRKDIGYCDTLIKDGCGCRITSTDNNTNGLCYFVVPKDAYHNDPDVPSTLLNVMYLAQAVISSTTIVTIALITQKYRLLLLQKRAEWSGANLFEVEGFRGDTVQDTQQRDYFNRSYSFWTSSMKWYYLAEVIIHLPHPILWMAQEPTGDYNVQQIPNIAFKLLQVFMFLRLYLLPNLIHIFSDAYINRFEIVSSHREMLNVGFQIRPSLTLKMFFYNNTALTLIFIAGLSLLIFGYTIFSLERVEQWTGGELTNPDECTTFKNFGLGENSFWWAYVTFSTVGYGEFVPQSTFGRITSAACAVTGITAFIVFSAVLVDQVSLTKEQKRGVEYLHTRQADEEYREAAEILIKTAYIVHMRPRMKCMQDKLENGVLPSTSSATHKANRVYYAIKRFRAAKRNLDAAFMQAEDVVVFQKLEAVESMVDAIHRELLVHQADFLETEKVIENRMRNILNKVAKYRRQGNVVV